MGAFTIAGVAIGLAQFRAREPRSLTDKDTLLVADFVNTTGESVFDGALRQAVSIALEQSPFLSIVSREELQDTLRLMMKSPDQPVVDDVARDACLRLRASAMIEGSIASIGREYVIGLNALNCQSGKTIASHQAEAATREKVLATVSTAASNLRRRLGESLETIERFDVSVEQATTPSIEAFKAFTVGEDIRARTGELGAVPSYKRAIELDPNFAIAYARLSTIYGNLGQLAEMRRNIEEAYTRRASVSERERFYIEGRHCLITPDPDCWGNVHEQWKRTYPRDALPHGNVAVYYNTQGLCDKGVENGLEAIRLNPAHSNPYGAVANAYLCLGRPAEAGRVLGQAFARHLDGMNLYMSLYRLAFFSRDESAMAKAKKALLGRPEETFLADLEADAAAFDGRIRRSHELRLKAEQLAGQAGLNERVLLIRAFGALYDAAQGDANRARGIIQRTAGESPSAAVLQTLIAAALLSRDLGQADALFRQAEQSVTPGPPGLLRPLVRMLRDVEAEDRSAFERLPPASQGELSPIQYFRPVYLRGILYLDARDGNRAVGEFQRILDHRGVAPTSPLYPLAYVEQARAYVLAGDRAKARKAYQDFLALWKDADPDIPILREAKAEYARLSSE